jgi:hypothetical protein
MNVRDEIEKYASEEDKPVLRWLFERNHWESQWTYVANCEIRNPEKRFMCGYRVWSPTPGGRNQYEAAMMRELLKSAPCTCTEVDGIGLICHADDNPKCFKNQAKAFLSKEGA